MQNKSPSTSSIGQQESRRNLPSTTSIVKRNSFLQNLENITRGRHSLTASKNASVTASEVHLFRNKNQPSSSTSRPDSWDVGDDCLDTRYLTLDNQKGSSLFKRSLSPLTPTNNHDSECPSPSADRIIDNVNMNPIPSALGKSPRKTDKKSISDVSERLLRSLNYYSTHGMPMVMSEVILKNIMSTQAIVNHMPNHFQRKFSELPGVDLFKRNSSDLLQDVLASDYDQRFQSGRRLTADRISIISKNSHSISFIDPNVAYDEIVKNADNLPMRQKKQQLAIWELLVTESSYVNQLASIIDIYLTIFLEIHQDFLSDVSAPKIFSNLEHVYAGNLLIWINYFSGIYLESKNTGDILSVKPLKKAFLNIANILQPYKKFCMEMNECRAYTQKMEKENNLFSTYLQWCDNFSLNNREKLWDQMAKPFQRLTKYLPILRNIQKLCDDEESINDIEEMIISTSAFVNDMNNGMQEAEWRNEIVNLSSKLDGYEISDQITEDFQTILDEFQFQIINDIKIPCPIVSNYQKTEQIADSKKNPYTDLFRQIPMFVSDAGAKEKSPDGSPSNILTASTSTSIPFRLNNLFLNGNIGNKSKSVKRSSFHVEESIEQPEKNLEVIEEYKLKHGSIPRRIVYEGPLRMRENQNKWIDCQVFLLTDMFLITKVRRAGQTERFKIIKPPNDIAKVHVKRNSDSSNTFACLIIGDFNVLTNCYVFQAENRSADDWITNIERAKIQYNELMKPLEIVQPIPKQLSFKDLPVHNVKETEKIEKQTLQIGEAKVEVNRETLSLKIHSSDHTMEEHRFSIFNRTNITKSLSDLKDIQTKEDKKRNDC